MSNRNDYRYLLLQEYQERQLGNAIVHRLRQQTRPRRKSILTPRRLRLTLVLTIAIITIFVAFVTPASAHAQLRVGHGATEPHSPALVAYRLAQHYYGKGDYDRAIEYFIRTTDLLPPSLIALDPAYATPFRSLGDVYFQLGQYQDALASYRQYIEITNDEDPGIVMRVAQLEHIVASPEWTLIS